MLLEIYTEIDVPEEDCIVLEEGLNPEREYDRSLGLVLTRVIPNSEHKDSTRKKGYSLYPKKGKMLQQEATRKA